LLVKKFDASGNVSDGVMMARAMNESFRVTVDYINANTIDQRVAIRKFMLFPGARKRSADEDAAIMRQSTKPKALFPGGITGCRSHARAR
jgi:hypothetical protein